MNKEKIKTVLALIPVLLMILFSIGILLFSIGKAIVDNLPEIRNFFVNYWENILITFGVIGFVIWFWWGLYYLMEFEL